MVPFQGVDFYDIDSLLTEEERMVRQTVRQFVEDEILPIIEECHRGARFPTELIKPIAALGILGANLEGYGCPGLGPVAFGLIMQELERGDSGIRSFASVQGSLCMYPIYAFGTEEQKSRWLPRMAAGEAIGCFGLTEPDFGSNPGGMRTKAVRGDGGYVLSGAKMWITNGSLADIAVVWAKLEGEIQGFLVERGTRGFTTRETQGKFSLRASDTSELILEDCRIPAEAILPKAKGLKAALMCLTQARYGIAWGAVGSAMACYHTAVHYALERKQFDDRPIASHQLVQAKLADMLTEITKAQLVCYHLGRLKERGTGDFAQVSFAKRNNVAMALQVARTAREILGANGIVDEYPVIRHMLNLESVYTYEGTHDIHTLILGERITGIPAYV